MTSLWSFLFAHNALQSFSATKVNIFKLMAACFVSTRCFSIVFPQSNFVNLSVFLIFCWDASHWCVHAHTIKDLIKRRSVFTLLKYLCVCQQKSVRWNVWFVPPSSQEIVISVFVLSIDVVRNEIGNAHFLICAMCNEWNFICKLRERKSSHCGL